MRFKKTGQICILPFALTPRSGREPSRAQQDQHATAPVRQAKQLPVLLRPANYPMPPTKLGLDAALWFNQHPGTMLYVTDYANDDLMSVWFRG